MAKREILQINTPEGDAVLRTKARKIARMDDDLRALARDMLETMHGIGVAIAAPQVGESVRLIVISVPPDYIEEGDPGFQKALYNPQIVRRRGGKVADEEGCLSLRNWYGSVARDETVIVRAYDMQDRELRIEAHGFIARVLQHEIDHLDGVMFTDHMPDPATELRYVEPGDPHAPDDDAENDGADVHRATETSNAAAD